MSEFVNLGDSLQVDPRLTIGNKKLVDIARGALDTTIVYTNANNVAQNQLSFQVQCNNNKQTLIDSYMYVEVDCSVVVGVASTPGSNVSVYVADNFALRQYPLASVTNVCNVQIDTQSEASNPSLWIHQLGQFQDFISGKGQAILQSITPIMPDQSPQYNDLIGSLKSPLNSYSAGGLHYSEPRGSFNSLFTTTTDNTSQWAFNMKLREPLFNPMLCYDPAKEREALAYVNKFDVTLTLIANLSRMFSLNATACPLVNSLTVTINSATLKQTWLTTPLTQALPDIVVRSYNSITANATSQTPFTAGQQRTIQSQSFQISQIPKKIWVWVNDSILDTATGYTKSDYNFSIEAVTVLFNNRAGLLSTFNEADLYNTCMAEENNVFSFVQSRSFTGSVLCIDPAKLLGLRENEAPGLLGNYQLQIQVTCTNISSSTITPYLYVTWGLDTIFTISQDNVSNKIQGFITPDDVLNASNLPANPSKFAEDNIYGGSIWSKIKKGLKKAFDFTKKHKLISKGLSLHPKTAPYASIASDLGLGNGGIRTNRRQLIDRALMY